MRGFFRLFDLSSSVTASSTVCDTFVLFFFFFKQKTAYEMRISDWSSDVCSSDLFRLRDGLIAEYHESVNGGIAMAQLGVAPARMDKVFRKWGGWLLARPEVQRYLKG